MTHELLVVDNLAIEVRDRDIVTRPVHRVSLTVGAGERVGLVGESGSGKSLTASAILGLLPSTARVVAGTLRLAGRDLRSVSAEEHRMLRGEVVSLVPQDPMGSLNPVVRIGRQLAEAITAGESLSRQAVRARAAELLESVGIADARTKMRAYPGEFSGGMRQRVLIAMALCRRPRLLIADEATTALDVTVQQQVLDLIDGLTADAGTAVVLITHDLAVVRERTDRIVVLRAGAVVESGATAEVMSAPGDEYTRELVAASPSFARPRKSRFLLSDREASRS